MNEYRCSQQLSSGHPSLPGHFPERALVPGVVILDEVAAALQQWRPQTRLVGLTNTKFIAPLLPEQTVEIVLRQGKDEHAVDFECRDKEGRLAQGRLLLSTAETS